MPNRPKTRSLRRRTAAIALGLALGGAAAASLPATAAANSSQLTIFEDNL